VISLIGSEDKTTTLFRLAKELRDQESQSAGNDHHRDVETNETACRPVIPYR
jgi:hypothetical protein